MADSRRPMSAPPEVVFSTATDADRATAWLPSALLDRPTADAQHRSAEWRAHWRSERNPDWSAHLVVVASPTGGADVRLALEAGDAGPDELTGMADESLDNLAREVAGNLQAG